MSEPLRCEGWRRYGGAFNFGPPRWVQCANNAIVLLTVEQDGQITRDSPACSHCWEEGISRGIKQIAATPLPGGSLKTRRGRPRR